MTDILEQLRDCPDDVDLAAIAEIERLRADKKILEEEVERLHKTYAAEIERLRAALEEIEFHGGPAAAVARQMLSGQVEDGSG